MGALFICFIAYRLHRATKPRVTQIPAPADRDVDGPVIFNPHSNSPGSWENPQVGGSGGTVNMTGCEFVPPPSYDEISHRDAPKVPTYVEAMSGRDNVRGWSED
jgi:hypothetical protein